MPLLAPASKSLSCLFGSSSALCWNQWLSTDMSHGMPGMALAFGRCSLGIFVIGITSTTFAIGWSKHQCCLHFQYGNIRLSDCGHIELLYKLIKWPGLFAWHRILSHFHFACPLLISLDTLAVEVLRHSGTASGFSTLPCNTTERSGVIRENALSKYLVPKSQKTQTQDVSSYQSTKMPCHNGKICRPTQILIGRSCHQACCWSSGLSPRPFHHPGSFNSSNSRS